MVWGGARCRPNNNTRYTMYPLHRVSKAFPPMWVVRCTCKSQDHKCDYLFIYGDVESSICDTEPPRQTAALLMDSQYKLWRPGNRVI